MKLLPVLTDTSTNECLRVMLSDEKVKQSFEAYVEQIQAKQGVLQSISGFLAKEQDEAYENTLKK